MLTNVIGAFIFILGIILLLFAGYSALPTMLHDPLDSFIVAMSAIIIGGVLTTYGRDRNKKSTMS
jgi:membrane protein DedA with SNARE-associated domain